MNRLRPQVLAFLALAGALAPSEPAPEPNPEPAPEPERPFRARRCRCPDYCTVQDHAAERVAAAAAKRERRRQKRLAIADRLAARSAR